MLPGDLELASRWCFLLGLSLNAGCSCGPEATDAAPLDASFVCGNGFIEGSEACDVILPAESSCAALGFGPGSVRCTPDCALDLSGCCGDGNLAPDEECEGSDLRGLDCPALGYEVGTLACTGECQLDDVGCSFVNTGSFWFDGADDVIDCPALPWQLGESATWEAWIFAVPGSPLGQVLSRMDAGSEDPVGGDTAGRGFAIRSYFAAGAAGALTCIFGHPDGGAGLPEATNAGMWHHLACVIDLAESSVGSGLASSILALLDDGSFDSASGPGEGLSVGATEDLYFGGRCCSGKSTATEPVGRFAGYLDEVRMWSYARSEEEIRHDLYRELRGDEPGLVAYYNFDEDGLWTPDSSPSASPCMLGASPGPDASDPTWSTMTPFP
jgi:hypothetical protein